MKQLPAADSHDFIDLITAVVRNELKKVRTAEVGVVTKLFPHESSGDKNNYECSVKLRDTGLELHRVPVATQRIGLAAMPNVNDLVLVQFVGGSLHGAVVTGRLYNDADRPPEAKAKELIYVCPDAAESGLRRLYLELPNGNKLLIDDDKLTMEIGTTKVQIKNSGDLEISSNAKVVVQSQGNMKIEAAGSLDLKAQADIKIEGLSVSIKGQTTAQLEGQATTAVKGPIISIAGMTSFSPS